MIEPARTLTWPVAFTPQDSSAEDHLKAADAFLELLNNAQRLSMLIENAERVRDTVRPHIYERVKADYLRQKEETQRRIEQERAVLLIHAQNYTTELDTLRTALDEKTDRLEELEFRQRAGEYPEQEIADQRNALQRQVSEHAKRISWLTEIVDRYTKIGIAQDLEPGGHPAQPEGQYPGIDVPCEDAATDHMDDHTFAADEQTCTFLVVTEQAETQEEVPVIICPETLNATDQMAYSSAPKPQAGKASSPNHVGGYITALEGTRKGDRFPLICSNISLGSSPGIDIRLNDPGVANFHARIVYKERRYYLENFDSMGRCYVNGVHSGYTELKDGDILRIGEIKLRVDFAATYR
jgi:hypothetical protein